MKIFLLSSNWSDVWLDRTLPKNARKSLTNTWTLIYCRQVCDRKENVATHQQCLHRIVLVPTPAGLILTMKSLLLFCILSRLFQALDICCLHFLSDKVVLIGSFEDSLSPGFLDTLKKPIYYCRKLLNIFCYIHDYLCFVSPENISHSIELFCALTITKDLSRYMKEGSIRFQLIHTFSWAARLQDCHHTCTF